MPKHNLLSQEQFIADCNAKHGFKTYDYSEVEYVRGRDKIKVICPKHGAWYPTARKHREGTGCRKCYVEGKKIDGKTMYKRFLDIHGDFYEYDLSNYNGAKSTIEIISLSAKSGDIFNNIGLFILLLFSSIKGINMDFRPSIFWRSLRLGVFGELTLTVK